MKGSLHLILGPMFSGKTTRLIQQYKTRVFIEKKVAVINYTEDQRYDDTHLVTHDLVKIPCIQSMNLTSICKDVENIHFKTVDEADTVFINEGQFFHDIYDCVLELVENRNKNVFICGLDGDFQRLVFGDLLRLIPFCDTVEKLSALCAKCRDGTPAIFSHRISCEKEQIVIGADNYIPVCRNCYHVLNKL